MTSPLRFRMYAQEMRALRSRKNRPFGKSNVESVVNRKGKPYATREEAEELANVYRDLSFLRSRKPLHMRTDRVLARAFIVVTHNCIISSKAVILLCEDMVDDHTVHGAFHQLRVAKAFKQLVNS